jgi:hypothetical protein
LIAAPAADGGDNQDGGRDDQRRVPFPNLLELLATQLLVYFIK